MGPLRYHSDIPASGAPDDGGAATGLFPENEGDNGPPLEGSGGNMVPPSAEETIWAGMAMGRSK